MDFRVIFIEICFSIFSWFWFSYLWNLPWSFVFDIYFILLNSNAVECLHYADERTYYLQLALIGFFRGCFASVLSSLNIILIHFLLTSTTGVCYKIHCSSVSRFVENSYLTFNAIQLTSCHEKRDLGVRNLGTNYKRIYIFSFFV